MASSHFRVTDTMPLEPSPDAKKVWFNFVPNVDLGHLLTMFAFSIGFATQWNIQDKRITVAEQKLLQVEAQVSEFKGDMKEIKRSLAQIEATLAVQQFMNTQQPRKN